jgi:general secretion pathway protein D
MLVLPLLGSCNSFTQTPTDETAAASSVTPPSGTRTASSGDGQPIPLTFGSTGRRAAGTPEIVMGSGRFVGSAGSGTPGAPVPITTGGDVTLNFANADTRDVLHSVLGDLLKVPYAVDPAVQGTITLQTGRPVPRATVLDLLTNALQVSGLALVGRDGLYLVVPIATAAREAALGAAGGPGFVTHIVSPQYVSASDLERVLEPIVPSGVTVKADSGRNVLIVSGSADNVANLLNTVSTFDVDYLHGMSFALLPLRNSQAKEVAASVTSLIASSGRGLGDLVKVVPINRMNAVLVTSMQPAYLERVRGWVERFDRVGNSDDPQLYVYRVQNGRAGDLARVLRGALGIRSTEPATQGNTTAARLQPGLQMPSTSLGGTVNGFPAGGQNAGAGILSGGLTPNSSAYPSPAGNSNSPDAGDALAAVGTAAGLAGGAAPTDIRVTADETNNALIISATSQEYAPIEAALTRLDIPALQVLIDATIAEVTLTNQLSFGLQYFFKSGGFQAVFGPSGIISSGTANTTTTGSAVAASFPGFTLIPGATFAFTSGNGSGVVLQALSQLTTVHVLSSPNLLVLNNQSARLQVGDQVPIATQSATSTITPNAPLVNTIDYRDTGIILTVTPRVNASGVVLLDISEEVSEVVQTTSSTIDSPTISQRRVTSSVAAQDGQTIGLGGLISDNRSISNGGVPILKDIPILGYLFGSRSNNVTRTELIVLITPHVVRGRDDADAVTQELRQKLPLTIPVVARRGR